MQPHQRSAGEGIRTEGLGREFASDGTLVQRKTVRVVEVQKPWNGARNMSFVGSLGRGREAGLTAQP